MEASGSAPQSRKSLSPWQKGSDIFRKIWPQMVYLSLVGMAIPMTAFELLQASVSQELVHNFRTLVSDGPKPSFFNYIEYISSYLIQYGMIWLFMAWVLMISYLSMIQLVYLTYHQQNFSWPTVIKSSLRTVIPRGILASAFMVLVMLATSILGVMFLGPLLQIALIAIFALSSAIPHLLQVEKESAIRAVVSAIRMNYAPPYPRIKWSIFFQLTSLMIFLFALVMLASSLKLEALSLDHSLSLPRELWLIMSPWPPITWAYLVTHFLYCIFIGFFIHGFVLMSSSYLLILKEIPNSPEVSAID